jgi:glutamyl-tRNA reductase
MFVSVWTLGINHTTAPLAMRERFAFNADVLGRHLHELSDVLNARLPFDNFSNNKNELALFSTCNRTEIYCAADPALIRTSVAWLARIGQIDEDQLLRHAYIHESNQAVRHTFCVASGLDSMALGETQVLGQLKQATRIAHEEGALGATLSQLFDRSFGIAKEVRTKTAIGKGHVSFPATGVKLAAEVFDDFSQLSILLVGAGEMISLCAAHFGAKNPHSMVIANRTMERSAHIAARYGADIMRLSELPDRLHEFDIVICCTASILPLIGLGAVKTAMQQRNNRAMFLLDLAVPRDIEHEVNDLLNVHLYTVDDLAEHVMQDQASRNLAAEDARVIVDTGVRSFMRWMQGRRQVPLIRELLEQTDTWRQDELQKARKMLANGIDPEHALQALSNRLTKKLIHGAFSELHSGDINARARAEMAIRHFFLRTGR